MGSELNKALAAFQADIPAIPKGATGDTGVYKFDYAPLEDITDKAMPLLGKNGLAYICLPGADDQGRLVLDYALLHESGEEKTGQFPLWLVLPEKFKAQTIGGLITYFRRYCLLAVTGIAPGGDDDDAAGAPEVDRAPAPPPVRRTAAAPRRTDSADMGDEIRNEERPGSADPADLSAIHRAYYTKLGFDQRTDALKVAHTSEQLVGHALSGPHNAKSHKNLSWRDARKLRAELEGFKGDRGALLARLAGVTQDVLTESPQETPEPADA